MRKAVWSIIFLHLSTLLVAQKIKQTFVSTDIDNFWVAYDQITATRDSAKQHNLLKTLYLDKASAGLKSLIEARNYTPQEFIDGITRYPKFWQSIRPNTGKVKTLYAGINKDIQKLQKVYPTLKPATIYFFMGVFRTGGTTEGNKVLIGSEFSLADKTTVVDEMPEGRQAFYKTQTPINELALLCTHEYVHTQQKPIVENLLSMCLYEGAAEFVSCKATGKESDAPAIAFGKANEKKVIDKFVTDLFTMSNNYNWLWGQNRNELQVRDLGYYVGYEMCERYYNAAKNKQQAIRELIELDYTNEQEVERIVDGTRLLPATLAQLYNAYDQQRPTVVQVAPFENGSQTVKPGLTKITVTFSEPLLKYNTGLDFGPLGEAYCPAIKPERAFAEDGRSWTFEADLQPNRRYQILISNNFRKENGVRLKPYLLDFTTTN